MGLQIVRIDKQHDIPPHIPDLNFNYHRNLMEKEWRTGLRPLHIAQPDGPSFTVEGNFVKWQKWRIRVSFNSREGLVLHNVGWVSIHKHLRHHKRWRGVRIASTAASSSDRWLGL